MNQSETADEWKWNKLEWIAAQSATNKSIMIFKPNRSLFTYQMPTTDNPLSIQGGTIFNKSKTNIQANEHKYNEFSLFISQNRLKLVLH